MNNRNFGQKPIPTAPLSLLAVVAMVQSTTINATNGHRKMSCTPILCSFDWSDDARAPLLRTHWIDPQLVECLFIETILGILGEPRKWLAPFIFGSCWLRRSQKMEFFLSIAFLFANKKAFTNAFENTTIDLRQTFYCCLLLLTSSLCEVVPYGCYELNDKCQIVCLFGGIHITKREMTRSNDRVGLIKYVL